MSIFFALKIQSQLFGVKIYNSKSQMFNWPAGKLDTKPKNTVNIPLSCVLIDTEEWHCVVCVCV
jgi:hypothetical protein